MPRGGARVGAGRPKKPRPQLAAVLGPIGPPVWESKAGDRAPEGLTKAPSDLDGLAKAFWETYAPVAIEQRTLVLATVPGFRELCEQFAFKQQIANQLRHQKPTTNVDGLLRHYLNLAHRVDSSLARFRLTPMGKPMDEKRSSQAPAANPWAKVAAK